MQMLKKIIVLIALQATFGLTFAATKMAEARDNWQLCIADQVAELDDGISNASDIATGVQSSCDNEFKQMLDTMTLGSNRYEIERSREARTKEFATRIVLLQRATKRQQQK
jgi:hypothetical protein